MEGPELGSIKQPLGHRMGNSSEGNNPLASSPGSSLGTFPRMLQLWELFGCDQQSTLYVKMGVGFVVDGWLEVLKMVGLR